MDTYLLSCLFRSLDFPMMRYDLPSSNPKCFLQLVRAKNCLTVPSTFPSLPTGQNSVLERIVLQCNSSFWWTRVWEDKLYLTGIRHIWNAFGETLEKNQPYLLSPPDPHACHRRQSQGSHQSSPVWLYKLSNIRVIYIYIVIVCLISSYNVRQMSNFGWNNRCMVKNK